MSVGSYGERLACRYLLRNGYKILAKNYRTKFGEIDIIAKNHEALIFCEVKTRRSLTYGAPIEAVDFFKQKQIKRLANFYLAFNDVDDTDVRYDVISIELGPTKKETKIEQIENAFY